MARILAANMKASDLFNESTTKAVPTARIGPRIVKTYDYRNESGVVVHQTVRYEPKKFSQRRPDGKDGWIWNLIGVRLVVYRLVPRLVS
jgi:hypothetical protein